MDNAEAGHLGLITKHSDPVDDLQKVIDSNLTKSGIYRAYCFSRTCSDCTILVSLNTKVRVDNPLALYRQTVKHIETFSLHFVETLLKAYLKVLPKLKQSRFALEHDFRQRVFC